MDWRDMCNVSRDLESLSQEERMQLAWEIGNGLLNLPAVAAQAGHKWPASTLRDYVHPVEDQQRPMMLIAVNYLRDFLYHRGRGLNTAGLLRKWWPNSEMTEIVNKTVYFDGPGDGKQNEAVSVTGPTASASR